MDRIESVHQSVAERVGINVEGRMHEMGDIGPEGLEALHESECRSKALMLNAHPKLAKIDGR